MPVYNEERFVGESIRSVLAQTFEDFEFLIIDDGSGDSTVRIVGQFKDPRIRLVRRPHGGIVHQLNAGLRLAKAPVVARMDGDDVSLPDRFARQYAILKEDATVGVVSSSYQEFDERGNRGTIKWLPPDDATIKNLLPVYSTVCHPSSMFRKNLVRIAGGYEEDQYPAEDFALWVRLAAVTRFANIQEPLLLRRVYASGVRTNSFGLQDKKHLDIALAYLEGRRKTCQNSRESFENDLATALTHYYHGSLREARKILRSLVLSRYAGVRVWRYFLSTLFTDAGMRWLRSRRITERLTNLARKKPHRGKYFSI